MDFINNLINCKLGVRLTSISETAYGYFEEITIKKMSITLSNLKQKWVSKIDIPWQRYVNSNWYPICGIGIVNQQLRSDVRRDKPEQLREQHEADESYAADRNDSPGYGGLGQILGNLAVDVQPFEIKSHLGMVVSTLWKQNKLMIQQSFLFCFVFPKGSQESLAWAKKG